MCILSPIDNILQVIVLHAWKGTLLINSIWKTLRMICSLATKKFVKINSIHLFLTNKISIWGIQKNVDLQEYNPSASFRIHQKGKFYYPYTWQTESVYVRKCRVVSWYQHEHVEMAGMKWHWQKQLTVAHVCMGCGKQMIIFWDSQDTHLPH